MTRRTPPQGPELRRRAEKRLLGVKAGGEAPRDLAGLLRLVHELQVHQVELELQNEELVRARAELETALARYAALYDFAPVGYLTLDADGLIHEINLAGAALLGQERGTLVGGDFAGHLQEASRDGFHGFLAATLASGATQKLEVTLAERDGSARLVHLEGLASGPAADGPGRCRIVAVDLSELRRLEARAHQGQHLEAVALLAAGVAHEINNPLAYLLEGMRTLRRELGARAPELGELQEIARDGCDGLERIREVVRSLSAFASPQSAARAPVDPGEELAAALRLASNELRHRARVVTHLGPLPSVVARPHELGRVFLNLLVNAAHACPEGGADRAEVTVSSATDAAGWALVEVSDTGSGMAPEVVERIFEPYFTTKPHGLGTGLGLALVHRVVTAAGGRVEVSSRPGAGSSFRVLLPPASGDPAPAGEARSPRAPPPGPPPPEAVPQRLRVLVVDDEPEVAKAIARSLRAHCAVTVAGSGAEALAHLERGERFDAVVCDLMMPELSGQALQAQVADRWPELSGRFVFLTGGAFGAQAQAFLAQTASAVLEKPFEGPELLALVRRAAEPRPAPGPAGKGRGA